VFLSLRFTAVLAASLDLVLMDSGTDHRVVFVAACVAFKRLTADAAEPAGKEPISRWCGSPRRRRRRAESTGGQQLEADKSGRR
jgi:hypothetical protein